MTTGCKFHNDCFTCPYKDCIVESEELTPIECWDEEKREKKMRALAELITPTRSK